MKTSRFLRQTILSILILLIGLSVTVSAKETTDDGKKFSQEQLDQLLAPIALYPDSLLVQILIASTYPLEIVIADRWIKQNKDLEGDQLNDALEKQPWDASVKALAAFPEVLAMMNDKLDWTPMLGDAFLAQEDDVLSTVQNLRQKAYEAGNLKTTEQQKVIVEKEVIVVQSANPQVVYVPAYDPWWVYGVWWWPAYPPFVLYPYWPTVALYPGCIWFGPGFFVGPFWGYAWGRCDWRNRNIYVNVNRNVNIHSRNFDPGQVRLENWNHDPVHRRGVAYRDPLSRRRFEQVNRSAVGNRRDFSSFRNNLRKGSKTLQKGSHSRTDRPNPGSGRHGEISQRPDTFPGKPGEVRGKPVDPGSVSPSTSSQANANKAPGAHKRTSPGGDRSNLNTSNGTGRGGEVHSQRSWGSSTRSGVYSGNGTSFRGTGGAVFGRPGGGGLRGPQR